MSRLHEVASDGMEQHYTFAMYEVRESEIATLLLFYSRVLFVLPRYSFTVLRIWLMLAGEKRDLTLLGSRNLKYVVSVHAIIIVPRTRQRELPY